MAFKAIYDPPVCREPSPDPFSMTPEFEPSRDTYNHRLLANSFEEMGFVVIRQLFQSGEVEQWRRECDRLWEIDEVGDLSSFRVDDRGTLGGRRIPERMDPVTDISPLFAHLSRDPRILRVVERLLGDHPILFKDKLIFKMPDTLGYPLHQDFAYVRDFGFRGDQQLAVAIAIDQTNRDNGATEVFSRLHHSLLPPPPGLADEVDESLVKAADGYFAELEPGDAMFFHSLCPHRAGPNLTDTPRRIVFFTYNSAETGDLWETYYRRGKP